jgi:hypothetical protein
MAKDSQAVDNIRTMPPPNGWQSWPTGIKASALMGVSTRQLRLLFESGNITRYACPDRTFRYDPQQIEELQKDLGAIGTKARKSVDDDDENPILDDLEEKPRSVATADAINKTLVSALANANQMVKEMHELLSKGAKAQADVQDRVIQRLLEREEAREKSLSDVYLAREAYFNHQLERDLAAKQASNLEARRSEMWSITKGHLDKLVDMGMAKWGIPKEVMGKLEPAIQLLQALKPAQLQVLLGSGFLTAEQEELVRKIVTNVPSPDDTAAAKVAAECERIRQEEAAKEAAQKEQEPPCATPPPEPPSPPQQ